MTIHFYSINDRIMAVNFQFEEEYTGEYANGKFYTRDEFYRQRTAEILET